MSAVLKPVSSSSHPPSHSSSTAGTGSRRRSSGAPSTDTDLGRSSQPSVSGTIRRTPLPMRSLPKAALYGSIMPSERVEAGLEQAELIAFRVGKNVPGLLAGLANVGRTRPELQQAFKLGILIAVGGVDVDVQPGLPRLRLVPAAEDDRRLRAAEPFARPDLEAAVLFAIEHDEVQDLAPEPRQRLWVAATEHELTDTTCH